VSKKRNSKRGAANVEYAITLGAVALVIAAMFGQTSEGINGVWRKATAAAAQSSAVPSGGMKSVDCLANAHGDSKVCSSTNR
jgi:Flp pilus assembly pilin Flp